jgi:hypothetical protein
MVCVAFILIIYLSLVTIYFLRKELVLLDIV